MFVTNRGPLLPEFFHHTGNKRAGEQFLVWIVHAQFGTHILHEILHVTLSPGHYEGGKVAHFLGIHANRIHFRVLAFALTDRIELRRQAALVKALCSLVVEVSTAHASHTRIHGRMEGAAARTPLVARALVSPKPVTSTERTSPHTAHIRVLLRVHTQQHTLAVDTLSRG